MNKEKSFLGYLKEKGLKSTRQMYDFVSYFLIEDRHFSVEVLYNDVKRSDPQIGYSTVYRTLKLFVGAGLVTEGRFSKRGYTI